MFARSSPWIYAGLTNSFPDLTQDLLSVSDTRKQCNPHSEEAIIPGCKIFQITPGEADATPVDVSRNSEEDPEDIDSNSSLQSQVLIFQYRGKFHAMDNVRSYPQSQDLVPFFQR